MQKLLGLSLVLTLVSCAPGSTATMRSTAVVDSRPLLSLVEEAIIRIGNAEKIDVPKRCAALEESVRKTNILAGRPYGSFHYVFPGASLNVIEKINASIASNGQLYQPGWTRAQYPTLSRGLEKVRLTRENRTRLPMSSPS